MIINKHGKIILPHFFIGFFIYNFIYKESIKIILFLAGTHSNEEFSCANLFAFAAARECEHQSERSREDSEC